eukprot:CAMPEP_0185729306 /NCGR_PEP_ID=MMETSP1171-20130828/5089_1 /TAXON_ID=374046 /ORGANISM="Helicotheca tamensis, Strain CCMP826" /LENGTH=225 /DNA_ID=CAMNT_0028398111 /DNA_START=52 /DNA_END=729 /DNA_ORIENTATION=-
MAVDDEAKEETPLLKSVKKEAVVVLEPDDDDDDDYDGTTKSCAVCCGDIFLLICIASILINMCMILSQIWPTVLVGSSPIEWTLRVYVIIFNIVYILVELEWMLDIQWITKFPLMANFMVRGIVFSFLGVIGVEQSIAIRVDMLHMNHIASTRMKAASLLLELTSYCMTCLGGLYFIMGVTCMKEFRDRCRRIEKEQKQKRNESITRKAEKEKLRKEILKEENKV